MFLYGDDIFALSVLRLRFRLLTDFTGEHSSESFLLAIKMFGPDNPDGPLTELEVEATGDNDVEGILVAVSS